MNRQAQAVVMLLLGSAVLKATTTDTYLRYVRPGLRPLLIIGGALLIVGAVMTLWYEVARAATAAADDNAGHGHVHREPRVAWLLILPVLALLLIAPPALGSYTAAGDGSVLAAQSSASDYAPLPPGDPAPLALLDYAGRAVFDHGRSLAGRNLQLSGFIITGPGGQPLLARIVVSCCAADGRPIKVGLSGNVPRGVAANTWIQVVGTYTATTAMDPINGAVVPYLQVATWQTIPAPKEQYE